MSLLSLKGLAIGGVILITLLGGYWPLLKYPSKQNVMAFSYGESFATGVFLGAALLHMLPAASEAFSQAGFHYPLAELIMAGVFLALLLLEHVSVALKHRHKLAQQVIISLSLLMLSIHSLFEGIALGIATTWTTSCLLLIAIVSHKGAASFALANQLAKAPLKILNRLLGFLIFALMTPLGIVLGTWVNLSTSHSYLLEPLFSALAAGTFLYIGTLHGLDRANLIRNCCNMPEFSWMLVGFSLMAMVAIWT